MVSIYHLLSSAVRVQKHHWQYVNTVYWLCSSQTLFSKAGSELDLPHGPQWISMGHSFTTLALDNKTWKNHSKWRKAFNLGVKEQIVKMALSSYIERMHIKCSTYWTAQWIKKPSAIKVKWLWRVWGYFLLFVSALILSLEVSWLLLSDTTYSTWTANADPALTKK